MLRVMTWNINKCGIGEMLNHPRIDILPSHLQNIRGILATVCQVSPDILVIQEYQTAYKNFLITFGLERMGYRYFKVYQGNPDKTLRDRVLIASRVNLRTITRPNDIYKYDWRNWNEVYVKEYDLRLLGVHVPIAETNNINGDKINQNNNKKSFLERLEKKFLEYRNLSSTAIILGDFNIGKRTSYSSFVDIFNSMLTEPTAPYTTRGDKKLDYIYINDVANRLLDKSKEYIPVETKYSDHKYLYIDLMI